MFGRGKKNEDGTEEVAEEVKIVEADSIEEETATAG